MVDLADNVRAYLHDVHLAVLATSNGYGWPQLTAFWYELRDDSIIMNMVTASKKVRNLRRPLGRH